MTLISTADLCDQYGDEVRVVDPLFRHYGAIEQFGGPIVTIKCFEDNSLVADTVRDSGGGRVIVVDGGGSLRRSLLGDRLVGKAVDQGWAGIVLYGALRDVAEIAKLPIGVLALGSVPRRTEKRGEGQVDIRLAFAGVTVRPGDFLYADDTGVIIAGRQLL